MKKLLKQAIQTIIAIILVICISNVFLGLYSRDTGWIDRDKASTTGIYYPNTTFLHGKEGRGHHSVDSRGYVNDVDKLADNYIISIGASHSQGEEVEQGLRYTDLLNEWLGYTDEAYVYNVSQNAYFLPKIVKGFTALTTEFPDCNKIIIEIAKTNFDIEELQDALQQREYDENQTGDKIINNLSTVAKIKIFVKGNFPLINIAKSQLKAIKKPKENDTENINIDEYTVALDNAFSAMRNAYSKDIIIMYHPSIELTDNGMEIIEDETLPVFEEECKKHNITFVNMSDSFIEQYNKDYSVPYGFSNTSMGAGHLNKTGHYLIAKELMPYVSEE